jgi:hypothetical protein
LSLILAGYDTDGGIKIGKFKLSGRISNDGTFWPVVTRVRERTVGPQLLHESAGLGEAVAEDILSHPEQVADEPGIKEYAKSKTSDNGSSLTIHEMKVLARTVAHLSAVRNKEIIQTPTGPREYWPVGGDDQIAILEKGKLREPIEQPRFGVRQIKITPNIVMNMTLEGNGVPGGPMVFSPGPSTILLLIRILYLRGPVHLDSVYYFEDEFRNATLYYDGGVLGFDPSNKVTDCILHLGPRVDRKSAAVQQLITGFPWKAVQVERANSRARKTRKAPPGAGAAAQKKG